MILDTEAVDALGGAGRRGTSAARALAIGRLAQREGARRVVPIPVLAEVYRGEPADAAIDRLVKTGVDLVGLSLRTVRLAGRLRNVAGTGSAVDAIVVATAIRLGGGIVATGDHDDLAALAANHPNVKVWDLTAR